MRDDLDFSPIVGSKQEVQAELDRLAKERELAIQSLINKEGTR